MRHVGSFESTGTPAPCHRSSSRRLRHRLLVPLSSGAALFAVLVAPDACDASASRGHVHAERHRPNGPSLQATRLPARWLQGARLEASLADGRRIEITRFAGDVVEARALDAQPEARSRLHAAELVGMQWTESACEGDACTRRRFRVASAAPDLTENTMPAHASNRDTWLYRVEHETADHAWQDVCSEDGDGMGLFVDGRWDAGGAWHAGGYTFSCARGVIAKCARAWGYKPWKTLDTERGPVDLQPLHAACTRAARADYCGDGVSHTRDGIPVALSDMLGLNPPGSRDGVLEAVFDRQGAVRVHEARVPGRAPACHLTRAAVAGAEEIVEVWR